jgi:hypothetical protein
MNRMPTNAVLLERINQVKDQVIALRGDYQALDSRITVGYVTKDEFVRYITEQKEHQLERHSNYQAQINSKVSISWFKIYAYGLNIVAAAIVTGLLGVVGTMILKFLQGSPPA